MTPSVSDNLVDLAAGAFLLLAVLIVWRRGLPAMVGLLACQGAMLALLPLVEGLAQHDLSLILVAGLVIALRVVALPVLLRRAIGSGDAERHESSPLVNTTASLLTAAALAVIAFAVSRPLVALDPSVGTRAAPAGIAVVLIGLFVMVSRRRALSQAVGFLLLDNGIAATAFLTTSGVPLIVELSASLDVLFAVLVLGVLTGRMRRAFGDTDVDLLQELHD